ncbi:MAG: UDP-N-acetylglucosamine 1-carboxyvinyltransferase [Bacteroidales bacterium]|nr:UDP-N-acetylglucosamine 1-carboxyvinyltransferase [Bacteroidales bacterium]
MSSFEIEGGYRLRGTITPQGAKNEALQILCATLLTDERVVVENVPDIRDVNHLLTLLRLVGVEVEEHHQPGVGKTVTLQARAIDTDSIGSLDYCDKASRLRGSIMMAGPLLARTGGAVVPQPGGDKIGRRRIDTHLTGMELLGAEVEDFVLRVPAHDGEPRRQFGGYRLVSRDGLKGCYMLLDEASVTGTANLVMAAVLAKGRTTIMNAACEPYVYQLCEMLNRMGAHIEGVRSNRLTIEGVERLHGTVHRLLPDMIEVGSFIGMAAMTQSDLTIRQVASEHLGLIPLVMRRLGIEIWQRGDDLYVPQQEVYEVERNRDGSILTISDAPWPGFTPDLISIALVTATQARGSVLIHQKMFESRLFFVDKLIDMGAQIILCDPHRATVIGLGREHPLRGTHMVSPDIRAGVALLIAAMAAQGESRIDNIEQIDRGYEGIDVRLNALGARIKRIES